MLTDMVVVPISGLKTNLAHHLSHLPLLSGDNRMHRVPFSFKSVNFHNQFIGFLSLNNSKICQLTSQLTHETDLHLSSSETTP